jgi:hypothetical protein
MTLRLQAFYLRSPATDKRPSPAADSCELSHGIRTSSSRLSYPGRILGPAFRTTHDGANVPGSSVTGPSQVHVRGNAERHGLPQGAGASGGFIGVRYPQATYLSSRSGLCDGQATAGIELRL